MMWQTQTTIEYPFALRPASIEEAGLFYSQMDEAEDAVLGTVGHIRMDFGASGKEFYQSSHLFYLDPPYHATEGYYQNIGEDGFTETDHIRLRDALMRIEGKFLLSYNDDEFIRSLYDRPGIYLMETTRINNIKQRYDNGAQFPELIIANYDMHERLRVAPSQMNLFDLTGGDTAWLKS